MNDSGIDLHGSRDQAEWLGASLEVEGGKAKPRAELELLQTIPGDQPGYHMPVEMPAHIYARADQAARTLADCFPSTKNSARADELAGHVVQSLLDARAMIDDLTLRLVVEKDAHRETANRLHEQIHALAQQLDDARIANRRDIMELVGAEMREMGTKAELERALLETDKLQAGISQLRRPWWKRLLRR